MSPEERLEALRDDARWNPIGLEPQHGRMPGRTRADVWRVVAGSVLIAAVIAAVFGGVAWARTFALPPAPAPIAGPTSSPSSDPTPSSPDPLGTGPAVPSPTPGVTADAAAQSRAAAWLAGAILPPGAVRVSSPPPGTTIDDQGQGWWCQPMAEADAYWTVSGMSMVEAANWLRLHPSNGLKVTFPQPETPDPSLTNDAVYDFPSATAFEGMTFELATWGSDRAVIHLEIGVLSSNSTCATTPPGTQLMTAGG